MSADYSGAEMVHMVNGLRSLFSPAHPARRDLVLLGLWVVCIAVLSVRIQLFEILWEFTRAHDDWELDEVLSVAILFAPALVAFALRRWSQLSAETRRRALLERDLISARDAAERASRAKSEFLANMSHEIRTPMNGIIGMTELALDTDLTEQQRDYLRTVRSSAETLLAIVNDILDISRIEAGRLIVDSIPFNLHEMLQNCMREMAVPAHTKGLELLLDAERGVPEHIAGDEVRLKQILINLLGNAVKFTKSGEITARVRLLSPSPGLRLRFEVSDNGIGIAPEKVVDIFDPFSQADGTITRRFGGAGLGLSISAKLVRMMGGEIAVESQPNVGSTFWFELPLQEVESAAPIAESTTLERLRGTRILVVDDNETNRKVLTTILKDWDFDTHVASDAPEALARMTQAHASGASFQIVLTDFQMPGTDGLTLASQIMADPRLRSTILLMLSSVDRHLTLSELGRLGIAAYLMKPVTRRDLERALTYVFGLSHCNPNFRTKGVGHTPACTGLRVLVAEDNLVNQKVVQAMLDKMRCETVLVPNGLEAVAAARSGGFDAILMDVQMPELDGLEATRRIRLHESAAGLPPVVIVGVTASAMKSDADACREAGMDGYLAKPYDPRQLDAEIDRLMQLRRRLAYQP